MLIYLPERDQFKYKNGIFIHGLPACGGVGKILNSG